MSPLGIILSPWHGRDARPRSSWTPSLTRSHQACACLRIIRDDEQVRETGAFTGGRGDLIDFKTALVELDEVRRSSHPAIATPLRADLDTRPRDDLDGPLAENALGDGLAVRSSPPGS